MYKYITINTQLFQMELHYMLSLLIILKLNSLYREIDLFVLVLFE